MNHKQASQPHKAAEDEPSGYEYAQNFVRDGATGANTAYGNMAGNMGVRTAAEPPESKPSD